jgi:hypothetical protein
MEGAELHRAAAFEQAPVEALQPRHGSQRGGRLDAAHHELLHQFFGALFGELLEPLVETLAHLAGRLLGESDRQDLVRLAGGLALFEQRAHDARHQHPGLARAGAGFDGDRAPRIAGDGVEGLAR